MGKQSEEYIQIANKHMKDVQHHYQGNASQYYNETQFHPLQDGYNQKDR